MIDFHSHILPNVDDGSRSTEETINLINEAKQAGFTGIISTSHYIDGYYECDVEKREDLLNMYKKGPVPEVQLYLGSEIYLTNDILQLVEERKASTINNSRYILFELPMHSEAFSTKEIVYKIIENNYIPIIAHPERYSYVQEDIKYVKELVDMGALFQANFGSIIGLYGAKAQKTLRKLLEKDLINFFGSDVHREKTIYSKISKSLKKLKKIISEQKIEQLTTVNPQKVLNDDIII